MSNMLRGFEQERKVLTFDLFDCLFNFRLITHFVGQVGRENNLAPDLVENFFQIYMERAKNAESFMTYHDLLVKVMRYLDMELSTKVFSANAEELYLMHKDLRPHSDVIPTLEKLRNNGYILCLFADCNMQLVQTYLDKLDNLISEKNVLCVDEMRCYKPRSEFFRFANDKFKLRSADDHFHVSSNYYTDIEPAVRMHWLSVYVNRSKTGMLERAEPSVTIQTLTDIEEAMVLAHKKIEEEERAAQEREMQAAVEAERQEQAAEEAKRQRELQARQQQIMLQQQQQMQQQIQRRGAAPAQAGMGMAPAGAEYRQGGNPYFVPQNEKDMALSEKMRHMSPTKARALAKARERALANAKMRDF